MEHALAFSENLTLILQKFVKIVIIAAKHVKFSQPDADHVMKVLLEF